MTNRSAFPGPTDPNHRGMAANKRQRGRTHYRPTGILSNKPARHRVSDEVDVPNSVTIRILIRYHILVVCGYERLLERIPERHVSRRDWSECDILFKVQ